MRSLSQRTFTQRANSTRKATDMKQRSGKAFPKETKQGKGGNGPNHFISFTQTQTFPQGESRKGRGRRRRGRQLMNLWEHERLVDIFFGTRREMIAWASSWDILSYVSQSGTLTWNPIFTNSGCQIKFLPDTLKDREQEPGWKHTQRDTSQGLNDGSNNVLPRQLILLAHTHLIVREETARQEAEGERSGLAWEWRVRG